MSQGFFRVEIINIPDDVHRKHIFYMQSTADKKKRRKVATYEVDGDRVILNAEVQLVMTATALRKLSEEVTKVKKL